MTDSLHHLEDSYEILEPLRQGGMGAIYKVRHRLLDQVRVVKVMHASLSEEEGFQERFAREARLATRLTHPNIAQVYDFSVLEGTAFLIMEYIDGLNFSQLLKQHGPPELDLTVEICWQSLQALSHLHLRQLVHRDISPDNLMLSRDDFGHPRVKLIDLGIAKPLQEDTALTKTGLFMGKLHYASPEQFGRKEEGIELDHRSDLYSFGVVLYQLLTGELPFTGSESAVIAGHLFHPPSSFDAVDASGRVPMSMQSIVLKALEKKAEDRYQSADDFAAALKAAGSGGEVTAPESTGATDDGERVPATLATEEMDGLFVGAERLAQLEQFTEAKMQLDTLLTLDPHNDRARSLRQRIIDSQVGPLLGDASRLLISQEFGDARGRLEEAERLDPDNKSVIRMLGEITAQMQSETDTLEFDAVSLDDDAGEEEDSSGVADTGEMDAPPPQPPPAPTRLVQLDSEPTVDPEPPPPPPPTPPAEVGAASPGEQEPQREPDSQEPKTDEPRVQAPTTHESAPQAEQAPRIEPAPPASLSSEPSSGGGNRVLVIGVTVAVGLIVAAVLFFVLGGDDASQEAADLTATTSAADTPEPGESPGAATSSTFLLDATPWAQVVSIETSSGEKLPVEVDWYTPVLLRLPPGSYRLGLRGPGSSQVRQEQIRIVSGMTASTRVVFEEVDLDRYFADSGWDNQGADE